MESSKVRKASKDDSAKLIPSLVNAFETDPFVNWLARSGRKKYLGFQRLFEVSLNILSLPFGEVLTTHQCEGGSLWIPSENVRLAVLKQISLIPSLIGISGLGRFKQLLGCMDALDKAHPHEQKHYYLLFIGVDPVHQKKGFGGALMQPIIDRCDNERRGAYLENTNLANEPFYKSFGFEVIKEISAGPGAPPLRGMWRDPR